VIILKFLISVGYYVTAFIESKQDCLK